MGEFADLIIDSPVVNSLVRRDTADKCKIFSKNEVIILEHTTGALFSIGPLEVTGTVTTTWAIILVLTVLSILATRNLKDVPGPPQNAAEMALDSLQNYFAGNLGWEKMRRYFPMFATFFIFIIVSNYSGRRPARVI